MPILQILMTGGHFGSSLHGLLKKSAIFTVAMWDGVFLFVVIRSREHKWQLLGNIHPSIVRNYLSVTEYKVSLNFVLLVLDI